MKKYSIGIDLGGTKILAGIIDAENGVVVETAKKRTKKLEQDYIVQRIIETAEKAICKAQIPVEQIVSIGIGAAGQVDRENGVLISAPNLNCANVELTKILQKHFNIPAYIGNDVEVATLGEMKFGSGIGYKNFVCVFVGTGVGSGIVCDGKHLKGLTGTAGEIGHIIINSGGRNCGCGEAGCLEAYASRTAIEKRILGEIKKGHKSVLIDAIKENGVIRSKDLSEAVDAEDKVAVNAILEASEYLSCGLASVINFYNPELIILGGGLIEAIDFFFNSTVEKTLQKSLAVPAEKTKIVKTQLKDYSGIVGAAMLYQNHQ